MYSVGILTISDRCHSGLREDLTGNLIAQSLPDEFYEIRGRGICPNDEGVIAAEILSYCEGGCDLVLTNGGIGFSPRDVTPEATVSVLDKNAPGIAELLRSTLDANARALHRGVAGVHERTLIVNLSGNRESASDSLRLLLTVLPRVLESVRSGATGELERLA